MPELVRLARENGFAISSIRQYKPGLEAAFLHYAGERLNEGQNKQYQ
jgi:hypothetical protein